jgi:hypothetical protein
MNTSLEKKINQKRRLRVLRERLRKLLLQYYVHSDAGKLEKHVRVMNRLRKAIKRAL